MTSHRWSLWGGGGGGGGGAKLQQMLVIVDKGLRVATQCPQQNHGCGDEGAEFSPRRFSVNRVHRRLP